MYRLASANVAIGGERVKLQLRLARNGEMVDNNHLVLIPDGLVGAKPLMPWALAVSFVVGAICAVRLPVLIFTLIVVFVMIAFAAASMTMGNSVLATALWSLAYAAMLEAGYIFVHGLFYLFYVKRAARGSKRPSSEIRSKYSSD
jgi:hypothetical protein